MKYPRQLLRISGVDMEKSNYKEWLVEFKADTLIRYFLLVSP